MTRDTDDCRSQIVYYCMDDLVPANHSLRLIDKAIDWCYTDVKLYCIQSGEGFYCLARNETDGVALATLRLTDTAGRSKTRRDDAIKIGIGIKCLNLSH